MSDSQRLCARVLGAALAMCLLFPVGSAFAQDADTPVNMAGLSFAPAEVHVAHGAAVLWTNTSTLAHTVTADDGSFDSGMLNPGDSFRMEFDSPGVYQYFCQPHGAAGLQGMSATIVVDDPDVAPAATVRERTPDDYIPTEAP
jgi:plastocyanin